MRTISSVLFFFLIFYNNSIAQISFHTKAGAGVSQFYKIYFSRIDIYTKELPTIGRKVGLGINFNTRKDKNITIDFMLEQKTRLIKNLTNDSIWIISSDSSYYGYTDIYSKTNFSAISVPILFNKEIGNKFDFGIGFSNEFTLNIKEKQRTYQLLKYQLKLILNLNYEVSNKFNLFLDMQNSISPFQINTGIWAFVVNNYFCSFGITYKLGLLE